MELGNRDPTVDGSASNTGAGRSGTGSAGSASEETGMLRGPVAAHWPGDSGVTSPWAQRDVGNWNLSALSGTEDTSHGSRGSARGICPRDNTPAAGLASWQMAAAKGACECPEGTQLVLGWSHEGRPERKNAGVPTSPERDSLPQPGDHGPILSLL